MNFIMGLCVGYILHNGKRNGNNNKVHDTVGGVQELKAYEQVSDSESDEDEGPPAYWHARSRSRSRAPDPMGFKLKKNKC